MPTPIQPDRRIIRIRTNQVRFLTRQDNLTPETNHLNLNQSISSVEFSNQMSNNTNAETIMSNANGATSATTLNNHDEEERSRLIVQTVFNQFENNAELWKLYLEKHELEDRNNSTEGRWDFIRGAALGFIGVGSICTIFYQFVNHINHLQHFAK